jgi:hypothetical protein
MFPKTWLACVALLAISTTPVQSHDIYTDLKSKRGASCCDGSDCRPVHYRVKGGGVQMLIDRAWFSIPGDLIDYRAIDGDMGETNGGHWCGHRISSTILGYDYLKTDCAFLPPNMTLAQ